MLRFGVPRQWLDCYPDYVSSHQLGLKTCLLLCVQATLCLLLMALG